MTDLIGMGDFFAQTRMSLKYTQQDAAEIIDVCVKTMQNLERGNRSTDFNTILKLCDLYKISPSDLERFYTRDPDMNDAIYLYNNSDKGKKRNRELVSLGK